jgi:transcriptional regulator with XRE-family HTH domain
MDEREQAAALRRQTGRELAAWRDRAGLLQRELAGLTGYSRGTVASAEAGAPLSRAFWMAADRVLGARGSLMAGHARTEAAVRDVRRRARAAREGAGVSGMIAAGPGEEAAAAGEVSCPHCGGVLTVAVRVFAAAVSPTAALDPD